MKFKTVLSPDKLYADIYAYGGKIKACLHFSIVNGQAVLIDDINHTTRIIETESIVLSISPFDYNKEEDILSAEFTLVDNMTYLFNTPIKNIFTDFDDCGCECKPIPSLSDFATKDELKRESDRRIAEDDKIIRMIGKHSVGQESLSSQLETMQTKLKCEIERSKERDKEHCEILHHIHHELDDLRHYTRGKDNELRNLIKQEGEVRKEGDNELYRLLNGVQKDTVCLGQKIDKVEDMVIAEEHRAKDAERELKNAINQEYRDRQESERKLYESILCEETARVNEDNKLRELIQEEEQRAHCAEHKLSQKLSTEIAERKEEDNKLKKLITESQSEVFTKITELEKTTNKIQDTVNSLVDNLDTISTKLNTLVEQIDSIDKKVDKLFENGLGEIDKDSVEELKKLPETLSSVKDDIKENADGIKENADKIQENNKIITQHTDSINQIKEDIVVSEDKTFTIDNEIFVIQKGELVTTALLRTIDAVVDTHDHVDGDTF